MAVLRLSAAARNAATDAISAKIDAGPTGGLVKIYDGAQPATPDTAVTTQILLATVVLGDPAFAASSAGTATGADPASVNASASGTATWFRITDSTGAAVMDGDASGTGGTGTLKLSSTSLVAGSPVDITSISHSTPLG